ncbi:hypothetical protein Tco_0053303 [Tanacetum coccineum]
MAKILLLVFSFFGSLCYIVRDGENLKKIKEKGDACIFVGYSTHSRAYRVYNKRTRVIFETIHVHLLMKLPQLASNHVSSDPVPQCLTMALEHASLSPGLQSQENVPHSVETITTSNELDLLFTPMFDELLNGTTLVVSKSSAVTTADAPNQRQHKNTTSCEEDVIGHIGKVLEILDLVKIAVWTLFQLRMKAFPLLLSKDAKKWWMNEGNGNIPISLAGAASEWFTKECIGSITTWDNVVEKFIMKFHHLSDHDEEEETEEDDNPNETDNLINDKAKGTEELWSESRVPYQLCDHICEPYRFKSGETKWPACTSDIGGFCNGRKLPGMVRVGSITYFQDHMWYDELADGKLKDETLALKAKIKGSFENIYELDYDVLVKLQECWWKVNAHEIAPFTHMENFKRGPYANIKTEWASDPYLDVNRIFRRDYEACNFGDTQENQGHKEHKGNPNLEPSNYKISRFEMMKYSFDDDEEYITIKESEYHNHSNDSLDAYKELLCLIDERWVVTTPDDE